MADNKTTRVRMLRTVQGEGITDNDEREIHVRGSVVDLSEGFAREMVGSKAAEFAPNEKLVQVPLHPAPAAK